ncbi:hypothetical protein COL516b_003254 [Colletotrichum fioriniae]|nr:uncharacterized protein COL516b_003254 [Colletotrichum fioriniae]KAJ0308709.1 hypothetical protein COL516b_003254 [Colletotrichum fioriniae]
MAETTTLPHISSLVQPAIRTVVSSEDNWKGKTSPAERRKIQNRLNQRTWRQRRKAEKQQQRQAKTQQSGTDDRRPSSPSSASSSLSPPSSSAIVASSEWAAALPAASVANDNGTTTYMTVEVSRQGLYKSKTSSRRSAKYMTLMALKYIGRRRQIADIRDEDLDDIYQLFLQHAHQSRRSPSPDPMSDSLIPLVQFNLFRGLMENMKTLGITMPMICDDDCVSPFGTDPVYNVTNAWNVPYFLRPTETQLTTVHHPWLDFLPLPRMRDNLIKAGDDWDDEALCLDMVGDADAPSGKGGMILWGEPWDPNSWEVTEDFVEKWRWIFKGCEEIIRSSNYWRAKRGEKRMRVDLESLRSIVFEAPQPPDYDFDCESHINFIDAYWKPLREWANVLRHTDQDEIDTFENAHESIEGCGEENVGWMKVSTETMGSDWYEVWLGSIGGDASTWYAFYQRPPEKVYCDAKGSKPKMNILCESELLRDETQDFDKWGWVFYRCTYDDDDGWARFKDIINDTSRQGSEYYEYPGILDKMKWTFLEDKERFDLDEVSLRSVVYKELPPADANLYVRGHINLVNADWQPARLEDYHEENIIEEHFSFPAFEGCTEENVGWMRLAVSEVGPSTFQRIPHLWYIVYQRPPEIVYGV